MTEQLAEKITDQICNAKSIRHAQSAAQGHADRAWHVGEGAGKKLETQKSCLCAAYHPNERISAQQAINAKC